MNNLIKQIKLNPTKELIEQALENGWKPTIEDLNENPKLTKFNFLLDNILDREPSAILYYKPTNLTIRRLNKAREKGFIADEETLLKYPHLCDYGNIMEPAIKKDPKLIKYITCLCFIKKDYIKEALNKYKLTPEDLNNNPDICNNPPIMQVIIYKQPELEIYDPNLLTEIKVDTIFEMLIEGKVNEITQLPFFQKKFGGKVTGENILKIIKLLYLNPKDDDLNEQKEYYILLNKIIDAITNIRYLKQKENFTYPSIVSLDKDIINTFNQPTNKATNLYHLINKIYKFTNQKLSYKYIKENILNLYSIFLKNHKLTDKDTQKFYNRVLNQHRNTFFSTEKQSILSQLSTQLELNHNKEKVLLNSKKLEKITNSLKNKNYEQLSITEEQFDNMLTKTKDAIKTNKDIKKSNCTLTDEMLNNLSIEFKTKGYISIDFITNNLNIDNKEIIQYIIKKYEQIKVKLLENIQLSPIESCVKDSDKTKLAVNPSNFIIGNKEQYCWNISELLSELNKEQVKAILKSKEYIQEIKNIIPLVNLIPELNLSTLINILVNYKRVRSKIISNNTISNNKIKDLILTNINDVINLSNAYSSISDITFLSLGKEIIKYIKEENADTYLEFYKKMLNRITGTIPPINFTEKNKTYTSGLYSDPERLLIGRKGISYSCIDLLDYAGKDTFEECLINPNGDVILEKDTNNDLTSRIFIFRRGNTIQLTTHIEKNYDIKIYEKIAKQILQQSIKANDNIDYILVEMYSITNFKQLLKQYKKVEDDRLIEDFPHADLSGETILVNSKKKMLGIKEEKIELDLTVEPKCKYLKPRKVISNFPNETELTRLKALRINLEQDNTIKEELSRNFEAFYSKEYKQVYSGEDWYIAVRNDDSIEEVILPLDDPRIIEETEEIKLLLNETKKVIIR